jgi:CBS domain containing-hemolysin-like protein
MSPWIELGVTLLLVAANAFFVASEFAIVKMRPTRLAALAAGGDRRAQVALEISHRLDAYLSANQLGITLASLALGWIGEDAFVHLLAPILGRVAGTGLAITVSFVLITFLHTVLGELAPKSLALQRTEPVVLRTARPLRWFYWIAFPVIWTLNQSSRVVLAMFRLKPASEAERVHSPEELRLLLPHVAMEASARRLIDRVFDYTHRVARQVMTPRNDVVLLRVGASFDENVRLMLNNQYTRYPLLDTENDRVVGYVHSKDVLAALALGRRPRMRDIAREPIWTTEDTPLEALRREFQRRRVHIAIVRNAAGTFTGIVTLEDLLEEVVGEILDEQDVGEVPPLVRQNDGRFEVEGRVTLDVARRDLGLQPDDVPPGVETIGDYLVRRLGAPPNPGDAIDVNGVRLEVIEVRDGRVRRLRGTPIAALSG